MSEPALEIQHFDGTTAHGPVKVFISDDGQLACACTVDDMAWRLEGKLIPAPPPPPSPGPAPVGGAPGTYGAPSSYPPSSHGGSGPADYGSPGDAASETDYAADVSDYSDDSSADTRSEEVAREMTAMDRATALFD